MSNAKIIVLTPIKNETWILSQFLETTSLFADHIIIADQNSTDKSLEICSKFPKVHFILNNSDEYNEAKRQNLLIETARTLFPNSKRILMALDADEIFSADSLNFIATWEKIKSLEAGTTIYFEKPDVLPGIKRCVRYPENYFAIGYVDDGIKHSPKAIHSKRIPEEENKQMVSIDDIKILHFAHSRKNVQSSKLRYYSVFENINNINPLYLRRFLYACNYNENKFYGKRESQVIQEDWLKGWEERNIDLKHFPDPQYSWYDYEVLHYFKKFGIEKFQLENIWCIDWDDCRKHALLENVEVPTEKIDSPSMSKRVTGKIIDSLYLLYRKMRKIK